MEISSHGLISRWNFHTWNPQPIQKLYSCKSQPSDERYRNFSIAIEYIDSYRNIDFCPKFDLNKYFFIDLSLGWANKSKVCISLENNVFRKLLYYYYLIKYCNESFSDSVIENGRFLCFICKLPKVKLSKNLSGSNILAKFYFL